MVATVYFVNWYLHNSTNNGWAYKVVGKYTTYEAARKAYYEELANYVDSKVYDSVSVTLNDSNGNMLLHDFYGFEAEAPTPVEVVPVEEA